jgi:peptide/nickel transport system ATP-binding protein
MSDDLLEVAGVNVDIGGERVVNNLSLKVAAGEVLGVVGASGSGKSMTALKIMGLLPQAASSSGIVRLEGEIISDLPERQMQGVRGCSIGMVFQDPMSALNPLIRIGDQVAETYRLHRRAGAAEARAAAREALDLAGLRGEQGALERYPYELSGGQRQRVAIAVATVLSPKLLIADEPTTALDVITQAQVLSLLHKLVRERNLGLILITHDLAVVAQLAHRVAVMHRGAIVEAATTEVLLRNPRHPYTAALLAAAKLQVKRPGSPRLSASTAVLDVQGIVREYPRKRRSLWHAPVPLRAVNGVTLSVHAGETVGLVGESGSGKSSLLRVILALERAQAGRVTLMGEPFSSARGAALNPLRRAIHAVFQDPFGSFDPRWTVERLIGEPFHLLDSPPTTAERRHRIAAVLEQVGLSAGDAQRLPREFSGGERQRIAIARALISEPAMIAFDEAVSALDVLIREQVLKLLADLAQRLKISFLFVSHDLQVIRAIADRVYVMQHGRIVEEGPTETVFASPRDAYTRALLAAAPKLPGYV